MGRKLFAPEVKNRSVAIDALVRARSEGALDRLMGRHVPFDRRWRERLNHRIFGAPPKVNGSALGDNEAVVRQLGFSPWTTMLTNAWYGIRTTTEVWVDATGSIVMEVIVSAGLGDFAGHRTLSTYFTDGTSLVMWEQGADLARLYSPTRTSMVSCGYFPQDLRDFHARIDEMVAAGKEVLHVWSVETYARRCMLHRHYMLSDGAATAEVGVFLAMGGLWIAAVAVIFALLGFLVSWSWAATYCAAHVVVKLLGRLGLFADFDGWVFRRQLRGR